MTRQLPKFFFISLLFAAVVFLAITIGYNNKSDKPGKIKGGRVLAVDADDIEFANYMVKFGKNYYKQDEYMTRKANFMANLKLINDHNAINASSQGFTLGLN